MFNFAKTTRFKLRVAGILYGALRFFGVSNDQVVTRKGVKFRLDLREGIDLSVFLFGSFQKHVYDNKLVKLPADAVVIDVGANIGSICLPIARALPESTVYCFEPTDFAFEKLLHNLDLNPELKSRVKPIQMFVSDSPNDKSGLKAYASWRIGGEPTRDEGEIHAIHGGIVKSSTSRQTSIDEFAKVNGLDRCDFIKIDTDGHELSVLRGALETIRSFRPVVVFEVMMHELAAQGISFREIEELIDSLGYRMFVSHSGKSIGFHNVETLVPNGGGIDVVAMRSNSF